MRRASLAAAVMALLVGCSPMVAGSPMKAPSSGDVVVAVLDTGRYPTIAASPMGPAGTEDQGRLLEAQRMANNVVGPWEVDPALRGWLVDTGVKPVAGALRQVGEDQCAICDVAATHGFVLGFYSARRSTASGARTDLLVGVLRFADSGAAAAAATEIVAKTLPLDPQFPMRPIQIAAHPDAKAYAMDFPNNPGGKVTAVKSFTPHGIYLLYVWADATDANAAATLVSSTLDRQKPLIDRFYPADPATFAGLPRDPTGLLARTVPLTGDRIDPSRMTVYEPRAALQFDSDPIDTAGLFSQTGVQNVSMGKTEVFEAIDATAAGQLLNGFVDDSTKMTPPSKPADAIPYLPGSKCVQLQLAQGLGTAPTTVFSCFVVADRYLIEADSAQLSDAHQQTAAQYRML